MLKSSSALAALSAIYIKDIFNLIPFTRRTERVGSVGWGINRVEKRGKREAVVIYETSAVEISSLPLFLYIIIIVIFKQKYDF